MIVIKTPFEIQKWRGDQVGSVGFVPTMGALHDGHAELLRQARKQNDLVVLSIFVNPAQFNHSEDFEKYPITWEKDLELAGRNQVDLIFAPRCQDIYLDDYNYRLSEKNLSLTMEGTYRPGHFDGVLTVVMRLFQLVRPTRAYFGEKDFQQLQLIKGMVDAFFMEIDVVPVPTVREQDGLAMSSRNVRLTSEQRRLAPEIYRALSTAASEVEARKVLEEKGLTVEYVKDTFGRRLAAAVLGEVRLIDNVRL